MTYILFVSHTTEMIYKGTLHVTHKRDHDAQTCRDS